mmetsp:Transcript_92860/g.298710  ORF Transcript_92860/g.298710 Transcript_92860/m.298710 type:complete len:240 (-) Transcript_92860:853-1572(-)
MPTTCSNCWLSMDLPRSPSAPYWPATRLLAPIGCTRWGRLVGCTSGAPARPHLRAFSRCPPATRVGEGVWLRGGGAGARPGDGAAIGSAGEAGPESPPPRSYACKTSAFSRCAPQRGGEGVRLRRGAGTGSGSPHPTGGPAGSQSRGPAAESSGSRPPTASPNPPRLLPPLSSPSTEPPSKLPSLPSLSSGSPLHGLSSSTRSSTSALGSATAGASAKQRSASAAWARRRQAGFRRSRP